MSQVTPRQFALDVTQKLQQAGYEAYWAGGCVRDQLRGEQPTDYDVATDATPNELRKLFGHRRTIAIGAAFGVITIIGPKSAGNIEIATFRSDDTYSDGRHPDSVTFSTAEHDAQRRDFTINGLFYDPVSETVIDFIDGQSDLKKGIVRAIGDAEARITEDKLRMIRGVRFAATFNFRLDAATQKVIKANAKHIQIVSAERISAEMQRMLLDPNRHRAMSLMWETGLLIQILPEAMVFVSDNQKWSTTTTILQKLNSPDFATALAGLLSQFTDGTQVEVIGRRWRLPNQVIRTCGWIVENLSTLRIADQVAWSQLQPVLINENIGGALNLLAAEIAVLGSSEAPLEHCRQRLSWTPEQLNPHPLIDGEDLKSIGLNPGPVFSQVIGSVRRAQLDDEICDKEQAIQLAHKIIASCGN